MKKLLSILCVSVILLTAASCKKETVIGPSNNFTVVKTVNASDWSDFDANTLSVDLNVPQLDNDYNESGAVLVYISYDNNTHDAPWEQIPETFDGEAFSFTHNPGHVTLYKQRSSGSGAPNDTDRIFVKIVLIDSQQ
ncbi:hypothetical protein GWR56_08975 [Mucilaginibacter sp. 14171R-50]|uniref:hypothetical protein n=1 Tax=Mucilaginibacter sp. 14171R-50 TaxID=2703789 RepID=UPI00138B1E9C|nr:hypothetical protein [Mucilaginibacter sp. 14171R-50]QHS55664.1 hypothetical protein GWR56_08975 [Mucilaginibacter sp. 14171R-50]